MKRIQGKSSTESVLDKIMDLNFFNFLNPVLWIKIITLVVIGFYIAFTFIVLTQVKVMTEILHLAHAKGILQIISVIHFLLAVSLFLLALVIL